MRSVVSAILAVWITGRTCWKTRSFGNLVRTCDPSTLVPTCPGWTVRELFHHVGRGHRWAAEIVATRAVAAPDPRFVPEASRLARAPAGLIGSSMGPRCWLTQSPARDPTRQCGRSSGPRPAWWWLRRRAFDTLIHAVDAAMAQGVQHRTSADSPPRRSRNGRNALPRKPTPVRPRCDPANAWSSGHRHRRPVDRFGNDWCHVDTRTGSRRRHAAWTHADLLLAAVRRRRLDETAITVVGDAAVWQVWVDNTPFESSQNRAISAMSTTEISREFDAARPNPGTPAP